jgi:hypothetical protein
MQDGGTDAQKVSEGNRATVTRHAQREKPMKKLTLSKETLRTLDDEELSLVAGGGGPSGNNVPPGNGCPNTKVPNENGCKGK